jgi:hypothetical protein
MTAGMGVVMSTISEVITIPLAKTAVDRYLLDYFQMHRRPDMSIVIPLHVSLHDFGLPVDLAIARDVEVHVQRGRDAQGLNDEMAIAWKPTDDGPYPAFTGRLITWSEGNPNESLVELRGTYEPPLGAAGKAFDDAIGHAIAKRTAHELLLELTTSVLNENRL